MSVIQRYVAAVRAHMPSVRIATAAASRSSATAAARRKPRLVVLGTGWSTFALVKNVNHDFYDVTMVSPRNHMVFTPLLASTAVGTLEFRSIAEPVSSSFPFVHFMKGEATSIDAPAKTVMVNDATSGSSVRVEYDLLCIGIGAQNNTFGIAGVREHMHFLKELAHAREIRRSIIRNVEAATFPGVPADERRRLLSFVVVGGGPTGVEFSAELHDFLMEDLVRLYPGIAHDVRITVIEGKQLLGAFDQSLREYTERKFQRDKITVRTGVNVVKVSPTHVTLSDGSELPYGLGVWNTGIGPRPLIHGLDASVFKKDRWGHVVVDAHLRVLNAHAEVPSSTGPSLAASNASPSLVDRRDDALTPPAPHTDVLPGVWAMGDCASVLGQHYAATAQVAEQQGRYLAGQLNELAKAARSAPDTDTDIPTVLSHIPREPFVYRHGGSLAFIGTFSAVGDFSSGSRIAPLHGRRLRGAAAWLLWRSAYLTQLGAWRNRIQVPADWMRTFIFGRDVTSF